MKLLLILMGAHIFLAGMKLLFILIEGFIDLEKKYIYELLFGVKV